jgi:pyruvate,water dikinase
VFARSAQDAERAIDALARALEQTPGGHFKARRARFFARRVRAVSGLRELPKFTIIRLMGIIRRGLLETGRQMVDSGLLGRPEDLFFLSWRDLQALAPLQRPDGCWPPDTRLPSGETPAGVVAAARSRYDRERLRRQIPRLLLSDGRAIYDSPAEASPELDGRQILHGSPVSPGVAEGMVHVVLNPHGVTLQPGEILVCPGTDPGWTPLFLAAGALVMEVGGLMTHGSVVAREYGIPAVVGVAQATTRLRTGQRVRVDGNRGTVLLLNEQE